MVREDVRDRPDEGTWSALEHGAHVRDVFRERLALTLAEDEPAFPNWDQDKTAVEDRYAEQDPANALAQLLEAAEAVAAAFEAVPERALLRRGLRGDGSAFTVEPLARSFVHDPVHHVRDVRRAELGRSSTSLGGSATTVAEDDPLMPLEELAARHFFDEREARHRAVAPGSGHRHGRTRPPRLP